MADNFDHKAIEAKWQEIWAKSKQHNIDLSDDKDKLYVLVMFSYPSGDKLHIGHWYNYGPTDSWARFKKLHGFKVFEPMGFDSFGLPAENYAIKHGVHPAISTKKNIKYMTKQLHRIGAMYDWDKYLSTSDPDYYKWTQWLFLKLYDMGLAYKEEAPVNWCPSCLTVLANEQVIDGHCERCETEVEKKDLSQWFFRITKYAEELLDGLDNINWPESTKLMQKNWIGRSDGTTVIFQIADTDEKLDIFTTRVDTIYGATFIVVAPEHHILEHIVSEEKREEVDAYIEKAKTTSEIERSTLERDKTGVFTGAYGINPITGDKIPVWTSDFVLATYGSGAIFGTPGHDKRDWEFATKFKLPIKQVIEPSNNEPVDLKKDVCSGDGVLINSGEYNGLYYKDGIVKITEALEKLGAGNSTINYRLRDWLISRQRYWGAPIPIIYCDKCGMVPVPEEHLPVLLPDDVDLEKNIGLDKSPLADSESFSKVDCPKCGLTGKREVDTMDTFVDSSWYFLRYTDPKNEEAAWNSDLTEKWLPVDQYVGGKDHATLHLLYSRFICRALKDGGYLNFTEPFKNMYHQGVITNNGSKMSKSRNNVVSPDPFVDNFGSDTFRMYLMFMGPYDEGGDWNDSGILGIYRFLNRIWRLCRGEVNITKSDITGDEMNHIMHKTIKSVTLDLQLMNFNTAISRIMECVNSLYKVEKPDKVHLETLIVLLAPFAPHLSEEIWQIFGNTESIFNHKWPVWDENMTRANKASIAVQVLGKLRGSFDIDRDSADEILVENALNIDNVKKYVEGKEIVKKIVIRNKLVNFVVR